MTIAEVGVLGAGELVPGIRGKIKAQYPRTTGTKKDGETWSLENLVVTDATGEIKVKVWDHPPVGNIKGRSVLLACHEGAKGLSGLKADDDEYKGKTTRTIKMTATGKIEFTDAPTAAPTPPPQSAPAADDSGEWPAEPESNPVPPPAASRPTKSDAEYALFAWAQLYIRCMDSADWLQTQRGEPGHPKMSAEQYHGYCTTMFIECRKCGLGNVK